MSVPDYQEIMLKVEPEHRIATLTLNRPHVHNALNATIRYELSDAVARVASDQDLRVLLITGAGERSFSVGADLKDPSTNHSANDFEKFVNGQDEKQDWNRILNRFPKAVIASVNGYCAGSGYQLALASDIMVASDNAQFWIPQVRLGLAPNLGVMVKLARIMGEQRMLEFLLTGRRMEAEEALRVGLVSNVYPIAELAERAREVALRVAENPTLAIRITKEGFRRAQDMSWDNVQAMNDWKAFCMFQTDERRERHQAFEDRKSTADAS